MTIKTFGVPLTYSKTETITGDTVLTRGEYYVFKKEEEGLHCKTRAIVERAIDPVGIKEDFVSRCLQEHGESPRVVYLKLSFDRIDEIHGTQDFFVVVNYRLEIHLQDMGSLSATAIVLIIIGIVIIGSFLVAAWVITRVLDAAEGVGGDLGIWGTGLIILIGFFILAVLLISGGKASVSKKGVKTG